MSTQTKSTSLFWQRLIDAWPIIAAMIGIAITWHVQITLIDYRLTKAEQTLTAMQVDAKENLEKLTDTVQHLQLDVQSLLTLLREKNGMIYGSEKEKH